MGNQSITPQLLLQQSTAASAHRDTRRYDWRRESFNRLCRPSGTNKGRFVKTHSIKAHLLYKTGEFVSEPGGSLCIWRQNWQSSKKIRGNQLSLGNWICFIQSEELKGAALVLIKKHKTSLQLVGLPSYQGWFSENRLIFWNQNYLNIWYLIFINDKIPLL
jgi:hypothetical protein